MYLAVVHPRLESRGRPFPRSPGSRSRVNLRVLRPLTRGPKGQSSPLRTPHSRPGVQRIFPTSRDQVPHGWPIVHHSMATGFPIPRGCCLPLFCRPFFAALFCSQPCCVPFFFATSRDLPSPRVPSFSPCLYPTAPPATQWREPAGSPSVWGPFCASFNSQTSCELPKLFPFDSFLVKEGWPCPGHPSINTTTLQCNKKLKSPTCIPIQVSTII